MLYAIEWITIYISIHSNIEARDVIFDENRFSSISRLKDIYYSVNCDVVDIDQQVGYGFITSEDKGEYPQIEE